MDQINQVICFWKSKLSKNNCCFLFEKEDCIEQYLFPLQVFLIHYLYYLFLFDQNLWCTKTNLFLCVKVKSY